jgi:hypothetical protein
MGAGTSYSDKRKYFLYPALAETRSLDTKAGGKILSPLPGIEPRSPGRPARSQPVARHYTELLRLQLWCSTEV